MECVLVSERSAKLNPGSGTKKALSVPERRTGMTRKRRVLSLTRRTEPGADTHRSSVQNR
jgi:hypothetical protein